MEERFEINEEVIKKTLNWLKINDPQNATHEKAETMLRDLRKGFHGMAHNDPEQLLRLQEELKHKRFENS